MAQFLQFFQIRISIHALREEGDFPRPSEQIPRRYFYPRPPRGGRPKRVTQKGGDRRFLSTPFARRATIEIIMDGSGSKISIHALREEGDANIGEQAILNKISIHALREEGDQGNTAALSVTTIFLSTPSARRATGTATTSF